MAKAMTFEHGARRENSPQRWAVVNFWGLCSCPKFFHVQDSSGFFSLQREEMIGCVEHGHDMYLLSQPRRFQWLVLGVGGNENSPQMGIVPILACTQKP